MENLLNTQNLSTTPVTFRSAKLQNQEFKIDFIREEDKKETLEFLKEFFFKDEPLNKSVELGECVELEKYSMKSIPDNCSFKAVNSEGKIAGVFINGLMHRPPADYVPGTAAASSKSPKFKKILSLMDYIEINFDVFQLYPEVETILDGKILAVDGKYRGAGIAGLLVDRSLQYMREAKIPIMHVLCSSHYSYRVTEKLGFQEVYCLKYSDFKINGEQVLKPEPPHLAAKVMVKEIEKVKRASC